jgi:hypothetical protein
MDAVRWEKAAIAAGRKLATGSSGPLTTSTIYGLQIGVKDSSKVLLSCTEKNYVSKLRAE